MSFIDNYLTLCKERGLSPTSVLKQVGVSHSMLPKWKAGGSEPTNKSKKKIADYFEITVAELESEIKKPTAKNDDEL